MSVDISPKRPPISSCTAAAPAGSGSEGGGSSASHLSTRKIIWYSSYLERFQTRVSDPRRRKPRIGPDVRAGTRRGMPNDKLLAIYLNDHLAGSTAALELAKRALGSNRDTQFEPALERLVREIDEDRERLKEIMAVFGVGEDRLKTIGAFVVEKVGRLKLNGSWISYSPLSRLVELEALAAGVTGKLALWQGLQQVADRRVERFDLPGLEQRARDHLELIEEQRGEAARIAF